MKHQKHFPSTQRGIERINLEVFEKTKRESNILEILEEIIPKKDAIITHRLIYTSSRKKRIILLTKNKKKKYTLFRLEPFPDGGKIHWRSIIVRKDFSADDILDKLLISGLSNI